MSVGLFFASLYATVFPGLFLLIAIVQPKCGFRISSPAMVETNVMRFLRGGFSPTSVALLTTFRAKKKIELTFVMTFLAFL
jgi:hypothetical protein